MVLLFVVRSYHRSTATATAATGNVPVDDCSLRSKITHERIEDFIGGGSRTRALTCGDVVHEDGEANRVISVDSHIAGERDDLVQGSGLGPDATGRGVAVPPLGEGAVDAADRQRGDEVGADPEVV